MHKISALTPVLACALGLLAACHAHRDTAPVASATAIPTPSIELREPRPGLYTAAQPAAADWSTIAARGVGTVIDLRAPGELKDRDEAAEVRAAGMQYIAIPVAGAGGIDDADALQHADLRRGNADGAGAVGAGFQQVVDEIAQLGVKAFDGLAEGFQTVVGVENDVAYPHLNLASVQWAICR